MRTRHYTLTAPEVHKHAVDHVQHYLRLPDHGPKCKAPVLFCVLFWAAARLCSLAAACRDLLKAPSDVACRNALLATLPDIAQLQHRLNRALRGGLPKILRRRPQRIAVDLTLLPYYGQPLEEPGHIYKGQRKDGTKQFFAYATAYVICKGCRYTLALRSTHHSDPWDEVVKDLLRQVRQAGVKIALVLLDRGFYSVDVIRYLQAARYPFVMPVIRRGRKASDRRGPSGTRVFFAWRRSGWSKYTLEQKKGRRATVTICVSCRRVSKRRTAKAKRQVWVYACWGLQTTSVSWVVQTYRQRFGIESSYRQLNQGRIRTSTREPLLRLLYVGLALILRNVYVWLHWEVLAYKRRGYRVVDLDQLPLRAMLLWLEKVAETLLGGVLSERPSERPMLT